MKLFPKTGAFKINASVYRINFYWGIIAALKREVEVYATVNRRGTASSNIKTQNAAFFIDKFTTFKTENMEIINVETCAE